MDDLAFKAQVHRWAIECVARSSLRQDLILHGGSVFAYCFGSGRVPKDVDFRLASHVHGSLARNDDGSSYAARIGEVLSEFMPQICPTWISHAERVRQVLHVDLFTPRRDEIGVTDTEFTPTCMVRSEGFELAIANKCYLLAGLGSRPPSATDLFDVGSLLLRHSLQPAQVSAIAAMMSRRRQREAQIRPISMTLHHEDLVLRLDERVSNDFELLRGSIHAAYQFDRKAAMAVVLSALESLRRSLAQPANS
ncbi:MAG: hypothetical protein QM770_01875 [Tepidisphaeraceae bacterium]